MRSRRAGGRGPASPGVVKAKTWFITASSRGFGRRFAEAALSRGDRVAATARDTTALADLVTAYGDAVLPIALDVRDKGAVGTAVEELGEEQVRDQFETNFFGALWVTQAALPFLRAQGGGHIVQISSFGGVTTWPNMGGYHASKWALEGLTDTLAREVAGFGVKVTLVEPDNFATDAAGPSGVHARPLSVYDGMRAAVAAAFSGAPAGDPAAAGRALLEIVDAENPPLRVFFGASSLPAVAQVYAERLKTWEDWADVSALAEGGRR
ncbi:SDR family NAD(P)-dependent oxidoreductase [Streptomyces sp. SudanB182_2057]|uniref:SDR family NAD(P)-dependent oxidoreductase n=1 Tax=Streptomyces sp. SudanB182_2057 TaxID=3035281 RepID=UPI003F56337E